MTRRLLVTLLLVLAATAGTRPAAAQPPSPSPLEAAQPQRPIEPVEPQLPVPPVVEVPADPDDVLGDTPPEGRRGRSGIFRLGDRYTLPAGQEIADLVILTGSAQIDGRVDGDATIIGGRARLAPTAVIEGSLVAIGSSLTIQQGARVERDMVVVGGPVSAPPDFQPGGEHFVIEGGAIGGQIERVTPWLTRGLMLGRPIVPDLEWVWWVVAISFLVYLALNIILDNPVRACARTLAERPLTALLVGGLTLLLSGPVILLLVFSVAGIAVVPFAICALVLAWLIGKVAVARWLGMIVVPERESTDGRPTPGGHGVRSFAIGFALLCVAYMIPVLGLIAWASVGVLGLGAAVAAVVAGYRNENPTPSSSPFPPVPPVPPPAAAPVQPAAPPQVPPMPSPPPAYAPVAMAASHEPQVVSGPGPAWPEGSAAAAPPPAAAAGPLPGVAAGDLITFPRARFRDRLAAFVLDVLLVFIAAQMLGLFYFFDAERRTFLLLLAYHIAFWTWKGTTVGGIICQLRLVRTTGEPLRFVDALVRGLSSIFSLAVLAIGALWIIKDPERQAWHDKIAGTYVVKVPRNWPV